MLVTPKQQQIQVGRSCCEAPGVSEVEVSGETRREHLGQIPIPCSGYCTYWFPCKTERERRPYFARLPSTALKQRLPPRPRPQPFWGAPSAGAPALRSIFAFGAMCYDAFPWVPWCEPGCGGFHRGEGVGRRRSSKRQLAMSMTLLNGSSAEWILGCSSTFVQGVDHRYPLASVAKMG